MTQEQKVRISRIAIIGAFLMAISCTLKITAFHLSMPIFSQWINVVLNAIIVYGCYVLGKLVGLSRAHKMLCGTAMLGYLMYSIILIIVPKSSNQTIHLSVLLFFGLTMAVSVWFLVDLVRNDLKETELMLQQMEEEIEE